jgi:hypothetical protein
MANSVTDMDAIKLIGRAVGNARARDSRNGQKHPRWVAVMDTFSLGSTFAQLACQVHGFDPDELVKQ